MAVMESVCEKCGGQVWNDRFHKCFDYTGATARRGDKIGRCKRCSEMLAAGVEHVCWPSTVEVPGYHKVICGPGPILTNGPDPWAHRSDGMKCHTCMWFVEKTGGIVGTKTKGRCRRHAPTMNGYPVVFTDDWCGDHKLA